MAKRKLYTVMIRGVAVLTTEPGRLAGNRPRKIFGRLDCTSGMRTKKKNRVFFRSYEEAIEQGYRPCKNCKPPKTD